PTPAQGVPDVSNPFDVLEEFGKTLEDNVREVIKLITQSELPAKTRLEPFPGQSRAGPWRMVQDGQIEKKTSPREADNILLVTQLDLKDLRLQGHEGETQD
uniref:Apolipoprotein C-I, acidic form n=1 Tax=Rhinopithecus bieti TaxID=61621 RepID=A0A2K6KMR3_RHIBE